MVALLALVVMAATAPPAHEHALTSRGRAAANP